MTDTDQNITSAIASGIKNPIDPPAGTLGGSATAEPGTLAPDDEGDDDTIERGFRFADFHAPYVTGYIQLADAKAGATFTVAAGVIAYLLNSTKFTDAIQLTPHWLIIGLALIGFALICASAVMSFLVILPRTPKGGDDSVFWKSVADLPSPTAFVQQVRQLDERRMLAQRLSHSFNLSRTCATKYEWLRRAMLAGAVGLLLVFFWWALTL
jgi:hypothetical protein